MNLSISENEKYMVVAVDGEIDHHYAAEIREQVDRKYRRSARKDMLVDFSKVTFMDSSGIGLLIGRYKNVKEKGGRLCASGLRPDIMRIFEMAGLKRIIEIEEGRKHAE